MGRTYAGGGKKGHTNNTNKLKKIRRRSRDLDQIFDEIQPGTLEKSVKKLTEFDEDLPGLGQYYCVSCAKYFVSKEVLEDHFKTKRHKRR